MLHFETHNIEPALAELAEALSRYLHDRLIAPTMRAEINVTLRLVGTDLSAEPNAGMGIQRRDVLSAKQRGKLVAPMVFDIVIPRQKDALETVLKLCHEWIHIAQLASGRYALTGRIPKPGKPEKFTAHWMGVSIGPVDDIPYALRPWEQEAHEWQHKLAAEFVERFSKEDAA
ncbi:MAG: hypothetical protein ACON4P_05085 [Candidatus Puniceispirillales bacterium]